jgi:hypothetical protein
MVPRALPTPRQRLARQRQHGASLQQSDRRELERAGWRTILEFRENNVRGRDGRLLQVEEIWHAEAERDVRRDGGGVQLIHSTAGSVDEVWARLRHQAELADVRRPDVAPFRAAFQAS